MPIPGQRSSTFAISNAACGIPATAAAVFVECDSGASGRLGIFEHRAAWDTLALGFHAEFRQPRQRECGHCRRRGGRGPSLRFRQERCDLGYQWILRSRIHDQQRGADFLSGHALPDRGYRNSNAPLGGPALSAGISRTFPILSSRCNLPAGAQAYSLNFTAIPHTWLGCLSTWPAGQTQPLVSTLNSPGEVTANAALVPAGTNGSIDVFASNDADLVIDVDGCFAPPGTGGLSFYSLPPCRVVDTRLVGSGAPFNGTIKENVNNNCGVPATASAVALNATVR